MDDLKEHGKDKDTVVLLFSEFGRRINDNGAGTDHGSGGVAFVIGGDVNGGLYGDFPSLRPEDQLEGDMHFSNDFRVSYSTILERWARHRPRSDNQTAASRSSTSYGTSGKPRLGYRRRAGAHHRRRGVAFSPRWTVPGRNSEFLTPCESSR